MTPEEYVAKAREHLKKHEWTQFHYCTACDCCGNHKDVGHKDYCERKDLINVFVEGK